MMPKVLTRPKIIKEDSAKAGRAELENLVQIQLLGNKNVKILLC
jgi:hypothetical protein